MEGSSQATTDLLLTDYSLLLSNYEVNWREEDSYCKVGTPRMSDGWVLHFSTVISELQALLELLTSLLISEAVAFKIPRTRKDASNILAGNTGTARQGKIVTVYPADDAQAIHLARRLLAATSGFQGPAIPTDSRIGNVLYTRYKIHSQIVTPAGRPPKFALPENVRWPFSEWAAPVFDEPVLLYNNKYKPTEIIKTDPKGDVIKAVYLRSFLRLTPCIIKEAKHNMAADRAGRTIQDRLLWQHTLYQQLNHEIPFPGIIDLFRIKEDLYLVMEFVDSVSLLELIGIVYAGVHFWPALDTPAKQKLVSILCSLLTIVQKLHAHGIIHRDLTPVNFLIDKKERIYLIDMELAYSIPKEYPMPPFRLGSPGFMSPEQEKTEVPTEKEDVYGLGGLMLYVFTGLSPVKLPLSSPSRLSEALLFLTADQVVSDLIANCLRYESRERPGVVEIATTVQSVAQRLPAAKGQRIADPGKLDSRSVSWLIENALCGLNGPKMLSTNGLWRCPDKALGLASGLAGVLYLTAKARKRGYSLPVGPDAWLQNWKYLHETSAAAGLLDGGAGLLLVIAAGLESGLLQENYREQILSRGLIQMPPGLSLYNGIAGVGLALNQCSSIGGNPKMTELSQFCVRTLLAQQHPSGYWDTAPALKDKDGIIIGLGFGTAGIAYYLSDWLQLNPDAEPVKQAVRRALDWLMGQGTTKNNSYTWNIATRKKAQNPHSVYSGTPGILLCLLKAYECLKDPRYQQTAIAGLRSLPLFPNPNDLTQMDGLSGLGELYLEAAKVLKSEEWQVRADRIAHLMVHLFLQDKDCAGYWSMNTRDEAPPSLLTGSSGVAHFLLRYQHPESINFCILQA